MRLARPALALALLSASCLAAAPGRADEAAGVLAGLERRYGSARTLQARFTQTYRNAGVEQVESGVVYMKRPGRMRWEYRDPETKLFVADGRSAYFYVPEERQVTVSPFAARDLRSTPLEILVGGGGLERLFRAARETETTPSREGTLLARLLPRSPQTDYDSVVVEVDARSFELRRLAIREATGATSEFTLTHVLADVKLDDRLFRFTIPRGVEVIQVDGRE